MKREFLINIFFLILVNVLIKPFYILFIETNVQDTLGPNVYGLYFGIFNIAFIIQILTDLGLQNYNSRTIAQKPSLLPHFLPKILGLKLLLSLVYFIAGIIIAAVFGYLSGSFNLFIWISANFILLSFILYLRTNIAASGHYRLDSVISVLDKLILIIILAYLLFNPQQKANFTIFSFVYAQSASLGVVFLLALLINFKLAGLFKISIDLSFAKKTLKKSIPFSLVIILMSLYMRMDGFMLERMLDDNAFQAGVYAASFRIYDAFNMIGYLFAVLLLPMFSSLLNKKSELLALIRSSHNLLLSISVPLVIGGLIYRQQIMELLYPVHADHYYGQLLGFLLLSYFAISISYIYGTLLTASSQLKALNKLLFAGVLINLVFNLVFIPEYGAEGAAIVTIFTQFFVLAGQYLLSIKLLKIGLDISLLIRRVVFILVLIMIAFLFIRFFPLSPWLVSLFVLEILFVFIAMAFGFIRFQDFRKPGELKNFES